MLSERKRELEDQVNAVLEENELLQNTVDDLREGTLVLEKQYHEKVSQVRSLTFFRGFDRTVVLCHNIPV